MIQQLRNSLRSPWLLFICGGYLLRIFTMATTGQNDVLFMPWMTRHINFGHWNLYGYLFDTYGDIVMRQPAVWAPYPYGFYLYTAAWFELLERLNLVDLTNWENQWLAAQPARYVFLAKAAYIPFDLGILHILHRVTGRVGAAWWAWAPTALYAPFLMGQNDIYPTLFAVVGTWYAARAIQNRSNQLPYDRLALIAVILLGIGSIFKTYPLIMLPPLVLLVEPRWGRRVGLIGVGCLIFGLAALPFVQTPAFLNGVLLNAEGTTLFRTTNLFHLPVPPFLIGYLILLVHLATRTDAKPHHAWLTGLTVLTLMLLWVPDVFYWQFWVTPFVIVTMLQLRNRVLIGAWFLFQFGFALTLTSLHREFGVALALHIADIFHAPNMPTALSMTQPTLARLHDTYRTVTPSLYFTALLLFLYVAATDFRQSQPTTLSRPRFPRIMIALPLLTMFGMLLINLYFSRNMITRNFNGEWTYQQVNPGETIVQQLTPARTNVTGFRLRIWEPQPDATVRICLYASGNIQDPADDCMTRKALSYVDNRDLFLPFAGNTDVVPATAVARIEVLDAPITIRYVASAENTLIFNNEPGTGRLDLTTLNPFSFREAFRTLLLENIFGDPPLLIIMLLTTLALFPGMAWLLRDPNAPAALAADTVKQVRA